MNKIIQLKRLFRITDANMLSAADIILALYLIDELEFTAYDAVTFVINFKTELAADIESARRFPTDESILDQQRGMTLEVKLVVTRFELLYNELKYFVKKAFPGKKTIWDEFGFDEYRKAIKSIPLLLVFIERVSIKALSHATELIAAGYTQLKIDAIQLFYDQLLSEYNTEELFKKERLTTTNTRITAMNTVYSKILLIHEAAQIIFHDDYAKLQQYRLPGQTTPTKQILFKVNITVPPIVQFTAKGTNAKKISVYWGDDDSSDYEMLGLTAISLQHTYPEAGIYEIKIRSKISEITELDLHQSKLTSFVMPAGMNKLKNLNLAANNIEDSDEIDALLERLLNTTVAVGTLDLSGGTNAAPSRAGILLKIQLQEKGWTVTTN